MPRAHSSLSSQFPESKYEVETSQFSDGRPDCLTVVESVAGAAGGEPHTEEGAECIVAPLTVQTAVFPGLALVDVLTLPSLLLETNWTRVVLGEILSAVTSVVPLSVDTYRALGAEDTYYLTSY